MESKFKYHTLENRFRTFWINLLERELADKELANHQVIDADGVEVLYLEDFDIEIELVPNAKNRSMKLSVGDATYEILKEKYLAENDGEVISDDNCPFVTETTFTIRDLRKGTRFFTIVRKFRGI